EIQMREENIRPQRFEAENQRLYAEDTAMLLLHNREFIEIPCPACESTRYSPVYDKNGFALVYCSDCETVFVNPRPSFKHLADHYKYSKSIKHWNDKLFPASENSRREYIFWPRAKHIVELIHAHMPQAKSIMDVGAGFGTFCEEIKKFSMFDIITAIEPSHDLAETCRSKGISVMEKPVEEIQIDEVDVITNFELIEHLHWPKDFITACRKRLTKNGLFILSTPNIKGFETLMLGKLSSTISPPNHLNYFHAKSLGNLLKRCGFDIIETLTPGKLDAELVRNKILEGEFDVSNRPFLRHVLIDMWETTGTGFQQFLADNGLSSHLWIVAKKI
ncbi:MAG: class I SAM-dependent methyltransferase, partial [Candidatus Omnitrophota bacterium]|nr:class I SAM-dependent methyltransferase [Candidatus Omnitrophota bacterium]